MKTLYGNVNAEQLEDYRTKLHKKLFWLLIYKDPNLQDEYQHVDFDRYFATLMKELNGLNEILLNPSGLVEILTTLQAAYNETTNIHFDYKEYRKFVLDAHSLLDKLDFKGGAV